MNKNREVMSVTILPDDEQDKKEIGDPTNSVFAVAFGNYYPDEIEGLYRTFELASERVKLLGPGWEVREMPVHG